MHVVANKMMQSQASQARCPRAAELRLRLLIKFAAPSEVDRVLLTTARLEDYTPNHINTSYDPLKTHLIHAVPKGQDHSEIKPIVPD